jgi:hypothetical protein
MAWELYSLFINVETNWVYPRSWTRRWLSWDLNLGSQGSEFVSAIAVNQSSPPIGESVINTKPSMDIHLWFVYNDFGSKAHL